MNNKTSEQLITRRWFAEPMVWMVIAIPLCAVISGMLLLTMAIRSYDGLVVDDYYKHGKEINRVLTRNQNALDHGLVAKVNIVRQGELVVDLDHRQDFTAPEQIEIRFLHRTRAGRDQSATLIRYADGLYRGALPDNIQGIWHVQLETADWRITGSVSLPDSKDFVLNSQ